MGTECLLRPYCPSPNLEVPQLLSLTFPSQFRILANTKSKILVLYNKGGKENGVRGHQSNPAILPHLPVVEEAWVLGKRGGISLELSVTPSYLSVGTGHAASCAGRASSSCVRARDIVG